MVRYVRDSFTDCGITNLTIVKDVCLDFRLERYESVSMSVFVVDYLFELRLFIWKQNDRCCREKEKNIVKLKL
jgi:hypothetical protein